MMTTVYFDYLLPIGLFLSNLVNRYWMLCDVSYKYISANVIAIANQSIEANLAELNNNFDKIAYHNPNWPLLVLLVLFGALGLTLLRQLSNRHIVYRGIYRFGFVQPRNVVRVNECLFNFLFYTTSYALALWIVTEDSLLPTKSSVNSPQAQSDNIWAQYSLEGSVPAAFKAVYFLEVSYYVHSLYATIFLNEWKKDSVVLLIHHFVAITLLSFSFLSRAHRVGMLVVYLHDQCDVILEGTKLLVKLSFSNKFATQMVEVIKNVGWVTFLFTWFYSRLYLYPLEAILPSAIFGYSNDGANWFPFMMLLFVFLFLILAMNIYWGFLILRLLVSTLVGAEELDDIREYDHNQPELIFREAALVCDDNDDELEELKLNNNKTK